MNDTVYDRLIDEAHAAQAARNGGAYKAAQDEQRAVDSELIRLSSVRAEEDEALAARRETACFILESFDLKIETTKAALTQHIASTYLASDLTQDEPADEGDDGLFEDITPIPNDEDEYASAKANGALS